MSHTWSGTGGRRLETRDERGGCDYNAERGDGRGTGGGRSRDGPKPPWRRRSRVAPQATLSWGEGCHFSPKVPRFFLPRKLSSWGLRSSRQCLPWNSPGDAPGANDPSPDPPGQRGQERGSRNSRAGGGSPSARPYLAPVQQRLRTEADAQEAAGRCGPNPEWRKKGSCDKSLQSSQSSVTPVHRV